MFYTNPDDPRINTLYIKHSRSVPVRKYIRIYIFVILGFGGICYRITGNTATKASMIVAIFAILLPKAMLWLKIPKLIMQRRKIGPNIVATADFGILYTVIMKWALSKLSILL